MLLHLLRCADMPLKNMGVDVMFLFYFADIILV